MMGDDGDVSCALNGCVDCVGDDVCYWMIDLKLSRDFGNGQTFVILVSL